MRRLIAASLSECLLVRMAVRFIPGGIGALAYTYTINTVVNNANVVVAASTRTAP